jgi:selenocysteine lyase/cysteine desulfurase
LIGVVESIPGRRIYSVTDTNRLNERVSTVSFRLEGGDPKKVADAIGKQGVYVWNGHNYALAIVEQTRLLEARWDDARGTRTLSTLGEIERFGEALKQVDS